MESEQRIQEEQYAFPYHYIPRRDQSGFVQHVHWSWGFRYLGGMQVAMELCDAQAYGSLLDLGCGDGRFLREVSIRKPDAELLGVDYSKRAIAMAKSLNPNLSYQAADVLIDNLEGRRFDVVTLIEVIEHIPPEYLEAFISKAVSFIRPGGRLVLTVPHKNARVNDKHFQHFDAAMLRGILDPHLDNLEFRSFDHSSRMLSIWFRFLGRTGKYFLITWKPLMDSFYRYYVKACLSHGDESNCMRIACVGHKPL